jgi:DNA repair protein RecO (recombination protein O)
MPLRAQPNRRDDQIAYVLHTYPYRETSLIVEAFTRDWGRVAMVARGAKRPRSELRGLLQGFQPLTLSWFGAQELKTLAKAEWRGGLPLVGGAALWCGFYLNELLLKLLPREDPHPQLFADYERSLADLAAGKEQATILRRFEVALLAGLGYALPLLREADTGAPIDPATRYHYAFDRGPRRDAPAPGTKLPLVKGATLVALSEQRYPDAETAAEAKRLMREILDHYLEQRGVESRRVIRELRTLDDATRKESFHRD